MLAKKAGIIQAQCLKRKWKTLKRCVQTTTRSDQTDVESDTGSLPDRLINPGKYEPVLPTTEEHTVAEHTENKESVSEEPRWVTPVYTYGSIN